MPAQNEIFSGPTTRQIVDDRPVEELHPFAAQRHARVAQTMSGVDLMCDDESFGPPAAVDAKGKPSRGVLPAYCLAPTAERKRHLELAAVYPLALEEQGERKARRRTQQVSRKLEAVFPDTSRTPRNFPSKLLIL